MPLCCLNTLLLTPFNLLLLDPRLLALPIPSALYPVHPRYLSDATHCFLALTRTTSPSPSPPHPAGLRPGNGPAVRRPRHALAGRPELRGPPQLRPQHAADLLRAAVRGGGQPQPHRAAHLRCGDNRCARGLGCAGAWLAAWVRSQGRRAVGVGLLAGFGGTRWRGGLAGTLRNSTR